MPATPLNTHAPKPSRWLVFAIALIVLLAAVAAGATAQSSSPELEIDVTQCGSPGAAPDSPECTGSTETVTREAPPRPAPKPAPAPKPVSVEVHDYNLRTGKGRVRRKGEETTEEAATLDLDPRVRRDARAKGDHDHGDLPDKLGQDHLPDVKTNGGSPFAGFGGGFDFVSSEEALNRFMIPSFLLPIYVSAGRAYNVPWNVLASINSIETDFGRIKRQISSAGALGWMQFMPGTWKMYGVDASGDGVADPWNPVDAIYAAARYLKASGAETDLRKAVFAYNHADWYVDKVLKTAGVYGSLPPGIVAETGSLAFGRFPVRGPVTYGDDFRRAQVAGDQPTGLEIRGEDGARAIATQNVRVTRILLDRRLARALAREGALPRYGIEAPDRAGDRPPLVLPAIADLLPALPALVEAGSLIQTVTGQPVALPVARLASALAAPARTADGIPASLAAAKDSGPRRRARSTRRGLRLPEGFATTRIRGVAVEVEDALGNRYRYSGLARLRDGLHPGTALEGGATVGRLGEGDHARMTFSVTAAGGARMDPRPLVDGYRLQEAADFYHVVGPLGGNPFVPANGPVGGMVSGTQAELARRVLRDPGIQVYGCGREDIAKGVTDSRVLGALLYLRRNGLTMTVTSLTCGHSYYTAGGSVSAHSYGAAVDIAAFNGQPVLGHQGPGSLTAQAIRLLMELKGEARPAQLISLMRFGGPSFAMADHADHLHVGYQFQAALGLGRKGRALDRVTFAGGSGIVSKEKVAKGHEQRLSRKLGAIRNPELHRGHGQGSIRIESERNSPADRRAAERLADRESPLRLERTMAPAAVLDLERVREKSGPADYALARVDGSGRPGWAPRQIAVLRFARGVWTLVGVPRDAKGRVANPGLTSLAVVEGGRGYAVGSRGAVALLRPGLAPRLLRAATRARLRDVAAERVRGRLRAVAVGDRGTVLALRGLRAARERLGTRSSDLHAVTLTDGRAVAVGSNGIGGPAVHSRDDGRWRRVGADLGISSDAGVGLRSVLRDGGALWVAGGISDTRTTGTAAELPFAARLAGGRWTTFCAGSPALAAVRELGTRSGGSCDRSLPASAAVLGPATDLAASPRGIVLAMPVGLAVAAGDTFEAVHERTATATAADPDAGFTGLALDRSGAGHAFSDGGRLARISAPGTPRESRAPASERIPVDADDELQLSLAPRADRAVVGNGSAAAVRGPSGWKQLADGGFALGAVGLAPDGTPWAAEPNTGFLLRHRAGRWAVAGRTAADARVRGRVLSALGAESIGELDGSAIGAGIQSLAFDGVGGYAVGANGAVATYEDGGWSSERSFERSGLRDVAAGPAGAVAVGEDGAVLERFPGSDLWVTQLDARALSGGLALTAADVLLDGTRLVAGAGAVLARRERGTWELAPLQPLGVRVAKVRGYRDEDGRLRVLALVGAAGSRAVLVGDEAGWRPLPLGAGFALTDFEIDRRSQQVWAVGVKDDQALLARTALPGLRAEARAARDRKDR